MSDSDGGLYYGARIPRAVECLLAGYRENAVSWIWRDLSEERTPDWHIDPSSLKLSPTCEPCLYPAIEFRWLKPEMIGEGI